MSPAFTIKYHEVRPEHVIGSTIRITNLAIRDQIVETMRLIHHNKINYGLISFVSALKL